jgi:gluconate 5-dehydrogenase
MAGLFDLTGKNVLVTGSTRGLGRCIGLGLAGAGARLIVNGTSEARVAECVAALRSEGVDCAGCAFDVTQPEAVRDAVRRIEEEIGPIDILVNNAGITVRAPLVDLTEDDWRRVVDINLSSAFRVGREAARAMITRGRGKVINIASLTTFAARETNGAYSASKGGVAALTRTMAVEWARHNIQANAIAPGYFRTDLTRILAENPEFDLWVKMRTPARRWGEPPELVGAVVFLASDASSFVNGQILYVDGGWTANL